MEATLVPPAVETRAPRVGTRSIELLMCGIGDCIAATGALADLAGTHGALEVYGGGLAELLSFPNIVVKDNRCRLRKELDTDYTLAIEPATGYTHFKQHLSYHFGDQLGLPKAIRRPHLCTGLATDLVLRHFELTHKGYIVVSRFAGWAPRVPAREDLDLVIGLLKRMSDALPFVEVGICPDPDNVSAHTNVNLLNQTSLAALYHILDGAALVFTLDTMVYHLAMEQHLTTPVLCWWGNIPPRLRAYPGSFDYHNGRCDECCRQDNLCVPNCCFNGTNECLTMDRERLTSVVAKLFSDCQNSCAARVS